MSFTFISNFAVCLRANRRRAGSGSVLRHCNWWPPRLGSRDGGVCPPVVGEAICNVDLKLGADGVHVAQAGCLHTVSQALLYLLETG
ncbi:hypothetical protein VFPPC_18074 [Pochonia chlamydosporia 170]|uniref:Uncharacterized protein n=1 Tax=Pochonia chlamydosporia 170 TaxID=1380566 RepID=A0A219APN0_METCM|nr:hypothetical protein VFPPC_18074 [Pochonia chlamydosporia 170]OWT42661.1 hypothetical protein VFPPC_18074 [Pochonia chlamydosporia 170]